MVNTIRSAILATFICSQLSFSSSAKDIAEYRIGDKLMEDIITPVPLMVVDPVATQALKEKEAQRVPVIFRFNKSVAENLEADIRKTYTVARSNFVRLMEGSFRQTQLEESKLETQQFDRLIASFKRQNKTFPLTRTLAEDWALGGDGFAAQANLLARIKQAMEAPIRHENLTNAPYMGGIIMLVSVDRADERISLDDVTTRGVRISRTNMLSINRARSAIIEMFSPGEEEEARFAARSLRVNSFLERELTKAARARRTEAMFVADNFQPGQIVGKQGQLVDQKIMAALTQIQEKTIAGKLQQQVAQEKIHTEQAQANNRWLIIGLSVAGAMLFALLGWMAFRKRPETTLLPAVAAPKILTDSPQGSSEWQQRALAAEEKVAQAHDAIRSGVMDQLKEKAVRSLVTQRSEMLNAQQAAAVEMAELERRLNELQTPLQDRLRAYESRIADLEKALAAKGEENRELIRAKIELMRKQLETERKSNNLQFN
jgi:hypothetical protein